MSIGIYLLVAILIFAFAYATAKGIEWLDRCEEDKFKLLFWEAEPGATADAIIELFRKVLIIRMLHEAEKRVILQVRGWIIFPWSRKMQQVCRHYLGTTQKEIFLDFVGVAYICPISARMLCRLHPTRLRIQRCPPHLQARLSSLLI